MFVIVSAVKLKAATTPFLILSLACLLMEVFLSVNSTIKGLEKMVTRENPSIHEIHELLTLGEVDCRVLLKKTT